MQVQAGDSSQPEDLAPTKLSMTSSQSNTPEKKEGEEESPEDKPASGEQTVVTDTQEPVDGGGELVAEQQTAGD